MKFASHLLVVIAAMTTASTVVAFAPQSPTLKSSPTIMKSLPVAETGVPSFQEIFDQGGLEVVKYTCVPTNFESIDIGVTFPEHWRPLKTAVSSKEESENVKLRLHSDMTRLGVFDEYPEMKIRFEELDGHLFGGRCRLQPGAYLVHQFAVIFSLWDDIIEQDPEFGKSSVDRLRRLLKARKQDPKAVCAIINEDVLDACFMACWEEHFAHIESASADLYSEEDFLTWLDGVENEFDHLCILDPSKVDIEKEWNNRIKSVGCVHMYELTRCNCGFSPKEELCLGLEDIKWLHSKMIRIINEIASIPKDVKDECGSLFTSTMISNQFSFHETLEHFIDKFQTAVAEFDSVANQLMAKEMSKEERNELESFLNEIRYSSVGWAEWHLPRPSLGGMMKGMRYNRVKLLHPAGKKAFNFYAFVGQEKDDFDMSAIKWDGNAMSQNDMMLKDTVIVVDDHDNVIRAASKKESHIFSAEQPRGILHRAFSAFLFDESTGELLLQKRASTKITFPNVSVN